MHSDLFNPGLASLLALLVATNSVNAAPLPMDASGSPRPHPLGPAGTVREGTRPDGHLTSVSSGSAINPFVVNPIHFQTDVLVHPSMSRARVVDSTAEKTTLHVPGSGPMKVESLKGQKDVHQVDLAHHPDVHRIEQMEPATMPRNHIVMSYHVLPRHG